MKVPFFLFKYAPHYPLFCDIRKMLRNILTKKSRIIKHSHVTDGGWVDDMKDERERLESHPNLLRGNPATYFEGDRAREAQKKAMESLRKKNMERKLIKEQLIEKMSAKDWDEVIRGAIERGKTSDKGFEVLRDTLGEKPKDVVDVNGAPAVVILSGESKIRD